jgi:hypothetical protein
MKIEIHKDPNPSIGRIVICEEWDGNIDIAKKVVTAVCENYPKDVKTKFLITCGGFLTFNLPEKFIGIKNNKEPEEEIVKEIIKEAEKVVDMFLSTELLEKLKVCTHYLTLGIDSVKSGISMTQNYIPETHVELVVLIDVIKKQYHWTGKSYPTSDQEKTLIRIPDLNTHFFLSEYGKVMILGCHDLTMFNDRNWERTGEWRKNIKTKFRELSIKEQPIYVLQHPHTTIKVKTWYNCWKKLEETLPSVKEYAGCGVYWEEGRERDKIEDVLKKTKKGSTIDFVISQLL